MGFIGHTLKGSIKTPNHTFVQIEWFIKGFAASFPHGEFDHKTNHVGTAGKVELLGFGDPSVLEEFIKGLIGVFKSQFQYSSGNFSISPSADNGFTEEENKKYGKFLDFKWVPDGD